MCLLFFDVRCEDCGSSHYGTDGVTGRVVIRGPRVRGKLADYKEITKSKQTEDVMKCSVGEGEQVKTEHECDAGLGDK